MDVDLDPRYPLFGRAPIYDVFLSCLDPRSLVWLARTCRDAYAAVADFKTRAFNINRHFSRYFANPIAFRSLQAETNTLVSGSDALQFLDRTFYPESDLDLYTHPGHSFEIARFLVSEGYHFAPRDGQERDWSVAIWDDWDGTQLRPRTVSALAPGYPHVRGVWTFTKTNAKHETLKIQVIEGTSSPVEVVFDFHSTAVMNLITADAAYSLYPVATFVDRSSLAMPNSQKAPAAIQKYIERGWRMYFHPTPADVERPKEPPFLLGSPRWIGDEHTWVVPLNQTGVAARPPLSPASVALMFDHVRCNGWELMARSVGYRCHWHKVQTTLFRYNYAIPDATMLAAIRCWAFKQGKHCHELVQKENWTWFDADLPGFLRRR